MVQKYITRIQTVKLAIKASELKLSVCIFFISTAPCQLPSREHLENLHVRGNSVCLAACTDDSLRSFYILVSEPRD